MPTSHIGNGTRSQKASTQRNKTVDSNGLLIIEILSPPAAGAQFNSFGMSAFSDVQVNVCFPSIADITDIGKFEHPTMQNAEKQGETDRTGIGCALAALGLNTLLIGLLTASFTQGPYSSAEQELWYRYGSLGFLFAGVIVPAVALLVARRSRVVPGASVAWMALTLIAFVYYAMMSGGGV